MMEQEKVILARLAQLKKKLEKDIERKLVRGIRNQGGRCRKFVSPGSVGAPDRVLLFPNRIIIFIELKRPGEKLRPTQKKWAEELKEFDFPVYCLDSEDAVFHFLQVELPRILSNNSNEGVRK
jgi:hypothetical protein